MRILQLFRDWIFIGALACLAGGILLLFNEAPSFVTWCAALRDIVVLVFGSWGLPFLPLLFLFTGTLTMSSFWGHRGRSSVLVLPQAMLFIVVGAGIVRTITAGKYPDGYVPAGGGQFIGFDQLLILFFTIGHSTEFVIRLLKDRSNGAAG